MAALEIQPFFHPRKDIGWFGRVRSNVRQEIRRSNHQHLVRSFRNKQVEGVAPVLRVFFKLEPEVVIKHFQIDIRSERVRLRWNWSDPFLVGEDQHAAERFYLVTNAEGDDGNTRPCAAYRLN